MIGSDISNGHASSSSLPSSHTSDSLTSSASDGPYDSSYSSDQGSGEDSQDGSLAIYEESSDESEFTSG